MNNNDKNHYKYEKKDYVYIEIYLFPCIYKREIITLT